METVKQEVVSEPVVESATPHAETPEEAAKRAAYNEKARIRNAARRALARIKKVEAKVVASEHRIGEGDSEGQYKVSPEPVPEPVKVEAKKVARAGHPHKHDDHRVNTLVREAGANVKNVLHGTIPAATLRWLQEEADALVKDIIAPQFDVPEAVIAVSIERLNKKRLAQYHPDRDGMGLRWRVDVNARSLGNSRLAVIATLLHEILHAVQDDHGIPGNKNFHNNEFQAWGWWLGIPTDEAGHYLGVYADSIFSEYAKKRGLEGDEPVMEEHKKVPKAPGSPLKKWTCECGTNARVATFFDATCNLCGSKFELQEAAK